MCLQIAPGQIPCNDKGVATAPKTRNVTTKGVWRVCPRLGLTKVLITNRILIG